MIPDWVRTLDEYDRWLEQVTDRIEASGGVLQGFDFLVVTDPVYGEQAGVGETLTSTVEQDRFVMATGAVLEFAMVVQQIDFFDDRPSIVDEVWYSYHVELPDRFVWRYDCHDDHHDLGTRHHVHIGRGRGGDRVVIRAAGQVSLDDVFVMMIVEGLV